MTSNIKPSVSTIEYYNKYIYDLNKVAWLDASNLTSLCRDKYNNIYKIFDKSGNNNHFIQPNINNQPKYHNGSMIFNNLHTIYSPIKFEYTYIIIICNERGLNPTYPFGVYEKSFDDKIITFGSNFNGEIYEILIFNIELEKKDKLMIQKYLLNKWDTVKNPSVISIPDIYLWLDISSISNKPNTSNNLDLSNCTIFTVLNNEETIFTCDEDTFEHTINTPINLTNTPSTVNKLYELNIENNIGTWYINGKMIETKVEFNSLGQVNNFQINPNINELLILTNTPSQAIKNKLYNFFSEKWHIDLSDILINNKISYINQYIPRLKLINKNYISLDTLFTKETSLTLSDTIDLSKNLNIQIPIPILDKFPNQLTIIDDNLYLTTIDYGVIYNVNQYTKNGVIYISHISQIPNNNIFAFKNIGIYDFSIGCNNTLYKLENTDDIHYFTFKDNGYIYEKNIDIIQKLNITLNKYDNKIDNNFSMYLDGWINNINNINKFELLFTNIDNNTIHLINTELIYFDKKYKTEFITLLPAGTYKLTIKEINHTLFENIIIKESVTADIQESDNNYIINLHSWPSAYKSIKKLDIYVSNNKNYENSTYALTSDVLENNRCSFNNILVNGFNWISIKDKNNIININVEDPIIINNNFEFTLLNPIYNTNEYNILLKDWTDSNKLELLDIYANDKLIKTVDTNTILDNKLTFTLDKRLQFTEDTILSILDHNVTNKINKLIINSSINKSYGFTNTNNIFTITLSNSENYDLTQYSNEWYVFVNNSDNNIELITKINIKNNIFTFIYNPLDNTENKYFYLSNNNDYSDIQIPLNHNTQPITFNNLTFDVTYNNSYVIKLINWTSNITIDKLYIIDTNSGELLTETSNINNKNNEYIVTFEYIFPQIQNYISICDKYNMSGDINYSVSSPIIYRPKLDYSIQSVVINDSIITIDLIDNTNLINYYPFLYVYIGNNDKYINLTFINIVDIINNQLIFI